MLITVGSLLNSQLLICLPTRTLVNLYGAACNFKAFTMWLKAECGFPFQRQSSDTYSFIETHNMNCLRYAPHLLLCFSKHDFIFNFIYALLWYNLFAYTHTHTYLFIYIYTLILANINCGVAFVRPNNVFHLEFL